MKIAEQIKDTLDVKETMTFYGVEFNRRGFAKCPFHSERTASLSTKGKYFKCFGCGISGGVIDFVMMYFDLNFSQAIIKLNNDFSLGLSSRRPSYRQRRKTAEIAKKKRRDKERRVRLREEYLKWVKVYQYLQKAITKYAPTEQDRNWHPVFVYAAQHLSELEHWLDENIDRLAVN